MTVDLDLADIQGNVLVGYGRLGFPKGRFLMFHVADASSGREFLQRLRHQITTAVPWPSSRRPGAPTPGMRQRPQVTLNIALTFRGLLALQVPTRTLRGLPDEFLDGMAARAEILGDDVDDNDQKTPPLARWDEIWQRSARAERERPIHIMVSLNAQMNPDGTPIAGLDAKTSELRELCAALGNKVRLLEGHRGPEPGFQDASAILERRDDGTATPQLTEHFGYRDGIADPIFEGQYPPDRLAEAMVGNGKINGAFEWEPLATGEFLLGHPDEAQEIAGCAMPFDFSRNGTFMAYRKLHQNVAAFRDYVARTGRAFAAVIGVPAEQGPDTLMAKMAGRWPDGVPLNHAPTWETWQAVRARRADAERRGDRIAIAQMERDLRRFTFRDDPDGARCPLGSHVRRTNTRDMLDPGFASKDRSRWTGSSLNNRRRILRRGLPYGESPEGTTDAEEHGVVMMVVCASLFRQFEFVQQQWVNYGLDFNAGNDTCPLTGVHGPDAKFVIPGDATRPPFICDRPPTFVETRGGEYFFVPSMTALRMIAAGVVDPT